MNYSEHTKIRQIAKRQRIYITGLPESVNGIPPKFIYAVYLILLIFN